MAASGGASLVELVDKIGGGVDDDGMSLDDLRDTLGQRAFGPFLVVAGLIATLPTGLIPGVGWTAGAVMCIVFAQVLIGAARLWLPEFLTRRKLSRSRVEGVLKRIRPWAETAGRFVKPRLDVFMGSPLLQLAALGGLVNALTMFPLGSVPFGAFPGSIASIVIGLGLAVRDGLMMLVGIVLGAAAIAATAGLFTLL